MKEWVIALISGLVGSVIGAIATSWATYMFTAKHRLELEEKQKKNLMQALSIELSTFWKLYMDVIGDYIEMSNDLEYPPLTGMIQTHQSYLSVYDNSANLIGLLAPEVAREIIRTYINVKAFSVELMHYRSLTKEYQDNISLPPHKTSGAKPAEEQIREFYPYLRSRHFEVKKIIEDTVAVLDYAI